MVYKKGFSGRAFFSAGTSSFNKLIKKSKKINATTRTVVLVFFLVLGTAVLTKSIVQAEQSGGSNESGATSRIKSLHDDLLALSYGSDTDDPDWGSLWNRIKTSAVWVPSCNAAANDVKDGKTFYCGNRTQQTGTYHNPGVCSTQQYYDGHASASQANNCTSQYTWTTPDPPVTGDYKKDPQTGLVWSQRLYNNAGSVTFNSLSDTNWDWDGYLYFYLSANNSVTAGAVYSTGGNNYTVAVTIVSTRNLATTGSVVPAVSGTLTKVSGTGPDSLTYTNTYGSNNLAVGNKSAAQLCSERGNGWRLPTQKEFMQAYIDGAAFNLTTITGSYNWSATEYSSINAIAVSFNDGQMSSWDKRTGGYVCCVRQP